MIHFTASAHGCFWVPLPLCAEEASCLAPPGWGRDALHALEHRRAIELCVWSGRYHNVPQIVYVLIVERSQRTVFTLRRRREGKRDGGGARNCLRQHWDGGTADVVIQPFVGAYSTRTRKYQ